MLNRAEGPVGAAPMLLISATCLRFGAGCRWQSGGAAMILAVVPALPLAPPSHHLPPCLQLQRCAAKAAAALEGRDATCTVLQCVFSCRGNSCSSATGRQNVEFVSQELLQEGYRAHVAKTSVNIRQEQKSANSM